MIIDDLRMLNKVNSQRAKEIVDKYKVEMIYYLVIKKVVENYCPEGAKDISDIHPDVLGCARDQMAMMASDQGIVRYIPGTGGHVRNLRSLDIDRLISASFQNSEALRKVVSSHIASSDEFKKTEMTDEELYEETSRVMAEISNLEDPKSLASEVKKISESFDMTAGGLDVMRANVAYLCNRFDDARGSKARLIDDIRNRLRSAGMTDTTAVMEEISQLINDASIISNDVNLQTKINNVIEANYTVDDAYTMYAPDEIFIANEEMSRQYGGVAVGRKILDANGGTHAMLKISPLVPELRTAEREYGILQYISPQYDGDASKSGVIENLLYQYDAQKGIIVRNMPFSQYTRYENGDEFAEEQSIIVEPAAYLDTLIFERDRIFEVSQDEYDVDEDGNSRNTRREVHHVTSTIRNNASIASSLNKIFKWQMVETLEKYSGQSLNETDIAYIGEMFDNSLNMSKTMFGDIEADGYDAVIANASNYFSYLEHVCSTVRDKMSSHEFEIHIDDQAGQYGRKGGALYCMYFTGESTENIRTAGNNNSRFFATYIYANYTPSRADISPQIGDIFSGGYDTYIIGSSLAHGEPSAEGQILNMTDNTEMTNEKIAMMRRVFDSYMLNGPSKIDEDIVVRKISKRVGSTGIKDITDFIEDSGTINYQAIKELIVDDRNRIKEEERVNFAKSMNADRFRAIVAGVGVELDLSEEESGDISAICRRIIENSNKLTENSVEKSVEEINKNLRDELVVRFMKSMTDSLRNGYDNDSNNYIVARQIYSKYVMNYIKDVMAHVDTIDADGKALTDKVCEKIADKNDATLNETLDELFGKTDEYVDENGVSHTTEIVKPDMCKRCSKRIMAADYENLYKLLAYDGSLEYVSDMTMTNETVLANNRTNVDHMVMQLYLPILYNELDREDEKVKNARKEAADNTLTVDEDVINNVALDETRTATTGGDNDYGDDAADADGPDDEALTNYDSAYEDKIWYDSNFAKLDNADDMTYRFVSNTQSSEEEAARRAIYVATHPLQVAAITAVHNKLSKIESNYSDENLKITKEGVIYYRDAIGDIKFKIGPIIDEAAYIQPIIEDDPDGLYEDSIEIERIKRNSRGEIMHDPDNRGLAATETVRVHVSNEIRMDGRDNLVNSVVFGGLDTSSYSSSSMSIPYRFYGMSGKIATYDGYDHTDNAFVDRVSISTYQSNILGNIDKALSLYEIAEHRNTGTNKKKALGIVYTNIGGSTLQKCYRTNTYIIENKVKCDIANKYLSHILDGDFSEVGGIPEVPDFGENPTAEQLEIIEQAKTDAEHALMARRYVASMVLAQADIYRARVVMPKIKLDQNIGLYNTVLNLHQCTDSNLRIDRKNMRMTDSKSRRVAMFTSNSLFDSTLSGTAKQLGGVAFLTDNIVVDKLTGNIVSKSSDMTDEDARCCQISIGVIDPSTGQIIMRYNNFPGAQAVDRQQLSNNAIEKAVMIAPNIKFAMVNMGSNMEDGYVIAKRAAYKVGHFNDDGVFVEAVVGDKIGDTESGNKGVIARIVDTDIKTDEEFLIAETKKYLASFMINHRNLTDDAISTDVENVLNQLTMMYATGKQIVGNDSDTFESVYKALISNNNQPEGVDINDFYTTIGQGLVANKVEPFYGNYELNHRQWQLFMDNPELDVAITNVCVLTRSNPSLLEYISKTRNENPEDALLVLRDAEGNTYVDPGACGRYNLYVDCHTAEDKNKDYTQTTKRDGRRYGAQELYALTAKHCSDAFIKYITSKDETLADRLMVKFNHKLLMNGFMIDPNSPDFDVKVMNATLSGAELKPIERDGEVVDEGIYTLDELPGHSVVDIDKIADKIVNLIESNASKKEIDLAVEKMVEGQFGVLFNAMFKSNNDSDEESKKYAGENITESNVSANDKLRHMFVTQFGRYGGNFAVLPECLKYSEVGVYHILHKNENANASDMSDVADSNASDFYDADGDDIGDISYKSTEVTPEGEFMSLKSEVVANGEPKLIAPLFITSRETLNSDSEVVSSHIDDTLQFNIYKTLLAGAIIDKLHDSDKVDDANYRRIVDRLSGSLTEQYRSIKTKKSLDVENMSQWLKKNVYATVFKKSMTSIWFGNFNIAPDEVGLSMEKAKNLGILKMKEGAEDIPDDYEHLWEKYEPIKDDTYVLINRSPGQTTGCIRALRPVIMPEDTGCIQVHPAFATIQDGDFDGDTIGVIGVLSDAPDYVLREVRNTLTMQANLINTADYSSYKIPGTDTEIDHVNPLFIAGNADVAIAKYNMMQKDENGNPVCGYDIGAHLDEITIFANIVEQLKQLDYDKHSKLANSTDISGLTQKRLQHIEELMSYYDGMQDSEAFGMIHKCITDNIQFNDNGEVVFKRGHVDVSKYEKYNKDRMVNAYRDMQAYVAAPSLHTHGESDFEMLENIIADANISKKGKAPQLNALLVFSGIHKNCSEDGKTGLMVAKNGAGKFAIHYATPEHPEGVEITPELRAELVKTTKIDFRTAQSDVPQSPHRSQIESHSAAQADKSDATGLGGSTAQKMQKIFGSLGYAELGLRISGPITQMFLDAKQNVTVCEKNLMVGKFLLGKICNFERIDQFTNTAFKDSVPSQVRNGQFTFSKTGKDANDDRDVIYLTPEEATDQLDNFLKMMGLPELSPIDREITTKCLKYYSIENTKTQVQEVKKIIKECDKSGDMTYAAMYGNDGKYVDMLYELAGSDRGIYSGSIAYETHVGMDKINKAMVTKSNKIAKDHVYEDVQSVMTLERAIVSAVNQILERDKGFKPITTLSPETVEAITETPKREPASASNRRGRRGQQSQTEIEFNRLLHAMNSSQNEFPNTPGE